MARNIRMNMWPGHIFIGSINCNQNCRYTVTYFTAASLPLAIFGKGLKRERERDNGIKHRETLVRYMTPPPHAYCSSRHRTRSSSARRKPRCPPSTPTPGRPACTARMTQPGLCLPPVRSLPDCPADDQTRGTHGIVTQGWCAWMVRDWGSHKIAHDPLLPYGRRTYEMNAWGQNASFSDRNLATRRKDSCAGTSAWLKG